MQKKKYIFHLNVFNDVDHISPVIYKFLEKGERVHVIFLSDYDYNNDYRIRFLRKYKRFSVTKASHADHFRRKLFFNRFSRRFLGVGVYECFIRCMCSYIWKNRSLSETSAVIYEFSGPGSLNFDEAKFSGIAKICIPHGLNIFKNYDINNHIKIIKKKTGKWPDFSNRSAFDAYVLQSERHRSMSIDWGQKPEVTFAWGSARFSPEWQKINLDLVAKLQSISHIEREGTTKIVFFLPHWSYNVDVAATINALVKIASIPKTFLVVKGHTRGTGALNKDQLRRLDTHCNVSLNSDIHSPMLVQWCDIVVSFGSSIAIEALIQKKPIIHPYYLHSNTTIFDDGMVVYLAGNIDSLIDLIKNIRSKRLSLPGPECKQAFMLREVYCDSKPIDVLERYYNEIISIAYKVKQKRKKL